MSEYRTLFDARGARYNRANRLFPGARTEEAECLFAHLDLRNGGRWLDVGAGGGFLASQSAALGRAGVPVACDASAGFLSEAGGYASRTVVDYEWLPFCDDAFAAAGCLAVLHHEEAPGRVLAEMLRVTAPGGRVVVGDVAAGSRAARFLNEFVDAHTETGHAGRFYEAETLAQLLEKAGGRDAEAVSRQLDWRFEKRSDARSFCRELFGLRDETEDADLDGALSWLGLAESGGEYRLPWHMIFAWAAAP
jgi:ubiquinone/menaquinone biosynthesis C-methylase UbiE